ncbi:penicillin-binding transpeptidase domain-containing protein [Thermoanaerobacterium sp. RBIITD]|uniref:peptidoglycan D,D-transpeptidase FtsI family protein n=1 Tax=Thermoanaerobacterium sp. RBIITD TaxID=1550240 RepID=UPI000BB9B9E0|nr:penicillin-binding transpeptidase domain-containing protein [Thermoanaerobacterium sp. RBIITD]SNX54617.1 peptidoglycan glycosyltransferase [Thermoanaerobacterium sp. RBIITD]
MLNSMNRNIKILFIVFSALFISLIVYLSYFQLYEKNKLITSSYSAYNKRLIEQEKKIFRGSILDRNGNVLAKSTLVNGEQIRQYPDGVAFANITGYSRRIYQQGSTGIENAYDRELLGMVNTDPMTFLRETVLGKGQRGDDVILTLDKNLQDVAYNSLGGRKGAVVAIDPKTGDVLAMVSSPSYDPNTLGENWSNVMNSPDHLVLNRATQGLYPPGSVFKIITTSAALTYKPDIYNQTFDDKGYVIVDGNKITNYDSIAYGSIDFKKAFYVSSNSSFVKIGLEVGRSGLEAMAGKYGLNDSIPFDIPVERNQFPSIPLIGGKVQLAESSIGQGKMLVTPLTMALMASAPANGGVIMKPHLMKYVQDPVSGEILEKAIPEKYLNPITADVADKIKQLMIGVVQQGTGTAAQIPGITVAGKTGTAENPHGTAHAWFVGFAPAENPKIVVAVIVENGGAGGAVAAPIAREVMQAYLAH